MPAPVVGDAGPGAGERRYSLAEAGRLLGLPRRLLEGLIDAGFVHPRAGARGRRELTFQDLVVLRAAQGLTATRLPAPRIARTLAKLRKQLPDVAPGRLRVEAVGQTIVVREDDARWQADTGQYLLAFDVATDRGQVRFIEARHAEPEVDWLARALALEDEAPADAPDAYRRAIQQDAQCSAAYANLGRLLHAGGRLADAQAIYEKGVRACAADATLLFNLAVLLEDRGDLAGAAARYRETLAADPRFADAHCNLGLLCERMGDARGALRHLHAYRQLARTS